MKIGAFEATLTHARVGDTSVALWRVAELERHVDRAVLAFVRASARANGLAAVDLVAADTTAPALAARFDLVLAAELVYDRAAFPALARAIAGHLAPGGRALLADAGRINTRAFYAELGAAGLVRRAREESVREEGLPLTVKLVEVARRC